MPFDFGYFGDDVTGLMSYDLKKDKYELLSYGWPLSDGIFRGIHGCKIFVL